MTDGDDLPIFRPQFGKRDRAAKSTAVPRFRNAVLALMRGGTGSKGRKRGRARIAVRQPKSWSRRVIVKVHIAPLRGGGAKAAAIHLRYIQRDAVGEDGSPGVLYGQEGLVSSATFGAPRPQERHQLRLIVSPEDGSELDLCLYVRRFMDQVERDLGQRLEWAAVNHFDTGNPHAHIVVRGVDRDGREVRLPRDYVAQGLRHRAQELATEELGPRPEQDIARQQRREVTLDRLTDLDRRLDKQAAAGRVEFGEQAKSDRARAAESLLVARLQHLETLRLAEKAGRQAWVLLPEWKERLRELGMRGDIIKTMHRALRGDAARYEILEPSQSRSNEVARPVYGRVVKKGLSDELRGAYFAVVETPSGGACYVPLDPRAADNVRESDIVRIESRPHPWRQQADEEIHRRAAARGGIYDPARVKDEGIFFNVDYTPKSPYRLGRSRETMTPVDSINGHMRRLAQLEKLGLATRTNDGNWLVGEGLLEKLDAKDKSEPRTRLVVARQHLQLADQVKHRGPVWLDRVDVDAVAPFGFGAELREAISERANVLRQCGIDPLGRERHRALQELEQQTLARRITDETGAALVRNGPRFRGTVRIHEGAGDGGSYAELRRGQQFVLVRANRDLRALAGRTVTLSRDAQGRLTVRAVDRERGGS